MSNPDSFIDEVTEEVRRDRLFAFFRKYGWIPVLLVLMLVGGAAWTEFQKSRAQTAARAYGDSLLAAIAIEDPAARSAALAAIAGNGSSTALTQLIVAADAVRAKNTPAALTALDAVAADPSVPQSYRDLARLKRVMLAGADMPAPERMQALDDLATPGRPFRPLALEQKAMVQIETGDVSTGLAGLKAVLEEPLVSQALRTRVSNVMVALGANPEAK